MKTIRTVVLTLVAIAVLAAAFIFGGAVDVAADQPHWRITARFLEAVRERSIARQSADLSVPTMLSDAQVIAAGAGEYAEMCTGCHLAPGMKDTEMRKGLYPMPPELAAPGGHRPPAEQFWIVKHGLKMTGMPAWGLTHDDQRLWSMVAFLQTLPGMSAEQYRQLVDSGEGSHHHDEDDAGHDHEEAPAAPDPSEVAKQPAGHSHEHGAHEHGGKAESNLSAEAAEAAATVDRLQQLLARGNTTGAAALLDPAVLIFEGGGAEKSRAEYAAHHLGSDAAFMKKAKVTQVSRTGLALGNLAWIATESKIQAAGDPPLTLAATETMILKRGPQGWRVTHIHWSSRAQK